MGAARNFAETLYLDWNAAVSAQWDDEGFIQRMTGDWTKVRDVVHEIMTLIRDRRGFFWEVGFRVAVT